MKVNNYTEDIIYGKEERSEEFANILAEIKSRTNVESVDSVEVGEFDKDELMEYIEKAKKSKNPVDQANLERVQQYLARLEALKEDGYEEVKTSEEDKHI